MLTELTLNDQRFCSGCQMIILDEVAQYCKLDGEFRGLQNSGEDKRPQWCIDGYGKDSYWDKLKAFFKR